MSASPLPAEDPHCTLMATLIQRMQTGGEVALARLYELTLPHVYGMAFKITGCRDLAEPERLLEFEPCPSGSPLDHLLQDERAGTLKHALASLTSIQRQRVALAFYKDLSHQEISSQTGLPLDTVKSHLKRAQDMLRGAFCHAQDPL